MLNLVVMALVSFGLAFMAHASSGNEGACEARLSLGAHAAAGGLIQFWIPGVAGFQGRITAHDSETFLLRGQFGAPRHFWWKDVKGLELLTNADGKIRSEFAPTTGAEIAGALNTKNPARGSFEDAVIFALHAHGPQIYNDVHYAIHLDAVTAVLTRFGITAPWLRIAAILHDVIEDTDVIYDEVKDRFGQNVADAVRAVSLPSGVARHAAFELVYPVIRATAGALLIKLADRIANAEDAVVVAAAGDPKNLSKYAREWPHFKNSLAAGADATARRMFAHLEQIFAAHAHVVEPR